MGREAVLGWLMVAAPVTVLVLLLLLPAATAIVNSFFLVSGDARHLGLGKYQAFFADAYSTANLRYTVSITTLSSATAAGISLGIAIYLRFAKGRLAAFIQALSLFPLFVPSVVISFALLRFLGPNGLLQLLLENLGFHGYRTPYLTPVGPFIGFVWEGLPLPVLIMVASLGHVSDHAIEAARDLGASSLRIFAEVLLPQMLRPMVLSFVLVFLSTISAFTVPYFLGPAAPEMMGPFMARTYGNLRDPETAELQAVVVLAVALVAGVAYLLSTERRGQKS